MSPLRQVTVSPATTVSFAGLKAVANMSTCASSARAAAGSASATATAISARASHHLTLILPSIHGCTAQTKFSVLPLAAVTLKVTLPFGGR